MNDQPVESRELVPENDLEKKLARIASGRTTFMKAFNFFLNSLVVVLTKPAGNGAPPEKKPLTVRGPEGEPLVVVFSSRKRAAATIEQHNGYNAAVSLPAWQVISGLPKNRGLVLNPGWTVGFTVPPDLLQKYRKRFRLERK
jgi:hypothetical protein